MKRYLSIILIGIFIIITTTKGEAQTPIIDSLKKISLTVSKDSAARLYIKIANIFTGVNADSVRIYATIAGQMSPKNIVTQGDVMVQFGNSYHMENKMDSALKYFNKALIHFSKAGNEKGVGKAYQSFAVVKRSLGDYEGAINDNKKALEIYEKLKWDLGVVNVTSNIANCYGSLRNTQEALRYSKKAFELSKKLNDSLKYFNMMMELGIKYNDVNKPDSALIYLLHSNSYFEQNNFYGLLMVLNANIANAYWTINKNTVQTKTYLYKALYYSHISGISDNLRYFYKDMAMCYILENKKDSAEVYFFKTLGIIDSVNTQQGLQQTKDLQTKYETEKKELQIKNQSFEIEAQEEKNKQKTVVIWIGSVAFICTVFFLILAFVNYNRAKKANLIVQNQNQILELQKKEVQEQKDVIEEKQQEIISSINYAQLIQSAVLTGEEVWNKISKEHFIVFQPRDIVSGDFYWAHVLSNGRAVFALADCTGHGVPGGFMSMLGNSFLNELVVENKLFKADEILNRLRDKVIAALFQKGQTQQKDGMDMALCVWNKMDNTLEFAGANNVLYLVRDKQLTEYKGDKMPIGAYLEENKKFNAQKISLQANDFIYLTTDGFADQFGGEKGKKFKSKQLENLLIEGSTLTVKEQKESLTKAFLNWKLNQEQTDDVSVIGIKVV